MTTKYSEGMSAEEEKSLMAEIEYEDACYAGAAAYDEAHAPAMVCAECGDPVMPDPTGSPGVLVHGDGENQDHEADGDHVPYLDQEWDEEALQMDTLRKAALNHRGEP